MSVLTPRETDKWGSTEYWADLSKDRFVHFTAPDRAEQILSMGKLLMRPPYPKFGIDAVNAVSVVWGEFVPGVQTTHIKGPLVAVLFQTNTMPKHGFQEEVIWDRDVVLRNPKIIPANKAISMIKGAPESIGEDDYVTYGKGRAARVAERFLEGKTYTLNIGDPIFYGKYKNKRGIIREFKTNEKGDPIVVIDQVPNPTGRKQPKELKLFRIRYDKEMAEKMKAEKKASASRVAERFITSGTFEAPPQLLKDIVSWALPVYAGHVLFLARQRLDTLRDAKGTIQRAFDQMREEYRNVKRNLQGLEVGGVLKIQLIRPSPSGGLVTMYVGAQRQKFYTSDGGPGFYTDHAKKNLTFRKNPYPRDLDGAAYIIDGALQDSMVMLEHKLRTLEKGTPDDEGLVETTLLTKEASKYATKAKHYATKTATTIPVDLTGWKYMARLVDEANQRVERANEQLTLQIEAVERYGDEKEVYTGPLKSLGFDFPDFMPLNEAKKRFLDPVTETSFEVMLPGIRFDKIKVILDFKGHSKRGGQWSTRDRELQIDVLAPNPRSVAEFKEGMEEIIRVARHECQHIGQDLIKELTPSEVAGGLPAPSIRDKTKTPTGLPADMDPRNPYTHMLRDPHALQDVEFYTRIEDEIGKFVRKVRRYPLNARRDALQVWVGAKPGPLTIEGMPGYVPTADFFSQLKRKQRGKWEKAVAEFVKGVNKAGVKLPPDAGKVAARFAAIAEKKRQIEVMQELDGMEREAGKGRRASAGRVAAKYKKKKEVPKADGKGTTTVYEYSEKQVQHRDREKAKRVEGLRKNLDKLRDQIKKDLKSDDLKTRMTALAVGLINDTYERVGNPDSAKDGHFGVTGWKVKHVTLGNGKATFKYVGKSGVDQEKETTDAGLISVLKEAIEGKGKDDEIFGGDVRIDSSVVNEYLEPLDITAKDIRGLHANRVMQERLKALRSKGGKLPEDKKEREKKLKEEFKSALEETAESVGHEPSTLKSQYLVPGLEDDYLKDGEVKEKLDKKGSKYAPPGVYCGTPFIRVASRFFDLPFHKQAIIHLNNATDGESDDQRGLAGLISSLTLYEQAIVQDMLIHDVPIVQHEGGYLLRGHGVEPDAVTELIGAGYLQDVEAPFPILLSDMFRTKLRLYTASARDIGVQLSEAFDALLQPIQDAVEGRVPPLETTEPWNVCPVCGSTDVTGCRCHIGDRRCPNGHNWVWCPVHERNVVVPDGVNTHELPIPRPKGCVCWIEDIHDHVDYSDPEFNEVLRQLYAKMATKTPAEIEDEEVERLVRPDPKKKPPRKDLRRRRMKEREDEDLEKEASVVASRWRRRAALQEFLDAEDEVREAKKKKPKKRKKPKKPPKPPSPKREEHKPGDTWKSDNAFVGKNPDGETQSFDTEDAAKAFAKGEKKDESEPEPDVSDEDQAPEESEEERQQREEEEAAQKEEDRRQEIVDETMNTFESLLEGRVLPERSTDDPRGDFLKDLERMVNSMSSDEREAFAASYSKALEGLKKKIPDKSAIEDAREDIGKDLDKLDAAGVGEAMARAIYADNVVLNPLLVGGTPLSTDEKPASAKERREKEPSRRAKAEEAYDYFREMNEDERILMAVRLGDAATDLKENSPRFREIQAIYNGLCMAAQSHGEDPPPAGSASGLNTPRVSDSFQALFSAMKTVGEEKRLLGSVEDFNSSESREALRTAMATMTDEELGDLIGGDDSPMYGLIETLTDPVKAKRLGPKQREKLRNMIEDAVLDNVALLDPMAMEFAEANGEKDLAKAAEKARKEFDGSEMSKSHVKGLEDFLESGDEVDSEGLSLEELMNKFRKFRIGDFSEFLKKKFKKAPERSIPLARAQALKKDGDLAVLTQRWILTPAAAR